MNGFQLYNGQSGGDLPVNDSQDTDPDPTRSKSTPARNSRRSWGKAAITITPFPDAAAAPPAKPKPSLAGQIPPSGWKKGDGIREPSPPKKLSGAYFDSYAEALASLNGPAWMPPSGDVVPTTNAQLQPYKQQLFDAMMDMTQFRDKVGNTSFQKRWLDLDFKQTRQNGAILSNDFYMPHVLEFLAWKIVVGKAKIERLAKANATVGPVPATAFAGPGQHQQPRGSHFGVVFR